MTETYKKEKFIYHGTGFPVILMNFPFKKIGKNEILDCDIEQLDLAIAKLVLLKPALLTGSELKFLRILVNESMEKFSSHFNNAPSTIKNWEDRKDKPVSTSFEIDFAIRSAVAAILHIEHQISANFLIHGTVLKAAEYRAQPMAPIQIPFSDIRKDPFFKTSEAHVSQKN